MGQVPLPTEHSFSQASNSANIYGHCQCKCSGYYLCGTTVVPIVVSVVVGLTCSFHFMVLLNWNEDVANELYTGCVLPNGFTRLDYTRIDYTR